MIYRHASSFLISKVFILGGGGGEGFKIQDFGNFELSPMVLLSPVKGKKLQQRTLVEKKINTVNLVFIGTIISYLYFFRPTVNAHFLIHMALIWKFV